MINEAVRKRLEQPISLVRGVEPDISYYDLLIQQQQIEELEDFETIDAVELANDVKQLLCADDPKLRRWIDCKPDYVRKIKYEYDAYPIPMRGPDVGTGVHVLACFAKSWSKDWGGEIIAYTECDPSDVVASFPGRIAVISNDAWWKVTQPNVAATEDLNYLFFTLLK
jgi:hypothetical protein